MNVQELEDYLDGSEALFLEPRATFDRAICGLAEQAGGMMVVAYDSDKCIDALVDVNGWDRDEAIEWFEFNTAGAYVGPGTPVFITPVETE